MMQKNKGILLILILTGAAVWLTAFSQTNVSHAQNTDAFLYYQPIWKIIAQFREDSKAEKMGEKREGQGITPSSDFASLPEPAELDGDGLTLLLIGTDNRPYENYIGNTDTLMLVRVNYEKQTVAVVSIPRDTQVNLPGYGVAKINAAARVGRSMKGTVKAVERLLNQPIDGYVSVNFAGFKDIVDTVGGVTIDVEKDMYYDTGDAKDGIINLKKGVQKLNGEEALQYARFRHDAMGDISRTKRQQAVVKGVLAELRQSANLFKVPALIPKVYNMVQTDLSLGQMAALGKFATAEDLEMVSQTLPGKPVTEKGISYWKVNSQFCQSGVKVFFEEGRGIEVFAREEDKP